jgi:hypothetical protein
LLLDFSGRLTHQMVSLTTAATALHLNGAASSVRLPSTYQVE